jgi:hypothetical protein
MEFEIVYQSWVDFMGGLRKSEPPGRQNAGIPIAVCDEKYWGRHHEGHQRWFGLALIFCKGQISQHGRLISRVNEWNGEVV